MNVIKMTPPVGSPARVRTCRVQEYLKLGWTMGWPEEAEAKDMLRIETLKNEQQAETADQLDAEEVAGDQEIQTDENVSVEE